MKTAASVSGRDKARFRKIAQKIIISHMSNYVGSFRWGISLTDDGLYPCVRMPTYRDYLYILSVLEEGGLPTLLEKPSDGLALVKVRNAYVEETKEGYAVSHRPEDAGKKDLPEFSYLIVRENILADKGRKRFKSRLDFEKFIQEARALVAMISEKQMLDIWMESSGKKKRKNKSYKDYLKDAGLGKNQITLIIRRNEREGVKMSRQTKEMTQRRLIRDEFFKRNRKRFDKTLERLRKMGIIP